MRVVVAGGGNVGTFIAEDLAKAGHEVVIVEVDADRVAEARAQGEPAGVEWIAADGCEVTEFARAGVDKDDLVRAAQSENAKLLEETRKKLGEEERRLARELRAEMAHLSLHATEKMLRRGLDKPFQDRLVQEALGDFEKWTAGKK